MVIMFRKSDKSARSSTGRGTCTWWPQNSCYCAAKGNNNNNSGDFDNSCGFRMIWHILLFSLSNSTKFRFSKLTLYKKLKSWLEEFNYESFLRGVKDRFLVIQQCAGQGMYFFDPLVLFTFAEKCPTASSRSEQSYTLFDWISREELGEYSKLSVDMIYNKKPKNFPKSTKKVGQVDADLLADSIEELSEECGQYLLEGKHFSSALLLCCNQAVADLKRHNF